MSRASQRTLGAHRGQKESAGSSWPYPKGACLPFTQCRSKCLRQRTKSIDIGRRGARARSQRLWRRVVRDKPGHGRVALRSGYGELKALELHVVVLVQLHRINPSIFRMMTRVRTSKWRAMMSLWIMCSWCRCSTAAAACDANRRIMVHRRSLSTLSCAY